MLTMKDIADDLGVSVSTVSLVLNDRDRGRVRHEIAEQVRARAEELGYVPNLLARGLRTRKSHTLGLLADRVATVPFGGQMIAGAQHAAWQEGYLLVVIDTGGDRDLDEPAARSMLQRDVEALVVAADYHREVALPEHPHQMPAVVLDGWPAPGQAADAVVPDEAMGGRLATEHLLDAGHHRIVLVTVSGDRYVAARLRRQGYEEALRSAGITPDPGLVWRAPDTSTRAAVPVVREILRSADRPTALFCFSDQIAMAVVQVAAQEGLDVPRDLSVVGFDNQQFVADAMLPGLTTVQLPHFDMGAWAARRAIARVRGELDTPPETRRMPCPLVVRESVAPPAP